MNLQVTHKPKRDYGHFGHHPHHQKEGESGLGGGGKSPPWFQPPPISPDIPPLFYEDAHKAEGNLAEENEKLKLLPVVKSLGEQGRNSTDTFSKTYLVQVSHLMVPCWSVCPA